MDRAYRQIIRRKSRRIQVGPAVVGAMPDLGSNDDQHVDHDIDATLDQIAGRRCGGRYCAGFVPG